MRAANGSRVRWDQPHTTVQAFPSQRRCWPFAPAFLRSHGRVDVRRGQSADVFRSGVLRRAARRCLPRKFDPDLVVKVSRMIPGSIIGAGPARRLRIIVSRSILVRASTTVPSASCPAARRRYLRPAPSNPWNHLRAPPHHRLWDRRNGSMRSLRVKRRCCALKGSVPAGRSRRSRFPRVLPQRVAVRGRSNRPQVSLRPTPFTVAMRAWVKCSSALSNDRASDDHLGI